MLTSPSSQPSSLRERTREHVFQLIRGSRGLTRSALVEITGYSSSTVGHSVSRLLAEGRLVESTAAKSPGSGAGRPATILNAISIGLPTGAIDFGHSHVRVALGDNLGNVVDEVSVKADVDRDSSEAIGIACDHLERLSARHEASEFAHVVAGVPGPLDQTSGLVYSPTILPGWIGLAPAQELQARLGVPVRVENDALLGAYGELQLGAGRHHRDFIYVKASDGVGASLVIDGDTYQGGTGLAGEIGHTRIVGRSEPCRCGNRGCLEAAVSAQSLRQQIWHSHPQFAEDDKALISLQDPITSRILNEAGRTLGEVLAELCNLANPTAVILGGEIGTSGAAFVDGVRASINRFAQPAIAAALEVVPAQLGRRAELLGALAMAGRRDPS